MTASPSHKSTSRQKNTDKQLYMRGASWKPRIKFYPWANVTGRNQLHLHNPLYNGFHTETKPYCND